MKTIINFSWVGPSPQLRGHDTDGPDQIIAHLGSQCFSTETHALTFFCLKEHKPKYDTHFAGKPIEVLAIEDFLQDFIKAESEPKNIKKRAQQLLTLMSKLLSAERNSIRDCVTIKVVFHYFLAAFRGGYIFDSNIKPENAATTPNFPQDEDFIITSLRKQSRPEKLGDIDIFAMYSVKGSPIGIEAFDNSIAALNRLEQEYQDKLSAEYYKAVPKALINSIFQPWQKHEGKYWQATLDEDGKTFHLTLLRLKKELENTHHHQRLTVYDRRNILVRYLVQLGLFKKELPIPAHAEAEEAKKIVQSRCNILGFLETKELESTYIGRTGHSIPYLCLHDAFFQIDKGNIKKLKEYLQDGLDVTMKVTNNSVRDYTLLHHAILRDNIEACHVLLGHPAGPQLLNIQSVIGKENSKAFTPQEVACLHKRREICSILAHYAQHKTHTAAAASGGASVSSQLPSSAAELPPGGAAASAAATGYGVSTLTP